MSDPGPSEPAKNRPSIRRSLALSFAQKYTGFLITLPSIMILSRLLTPAQIGIYSVAVAFVNIVHMLRDFGVSEYLVQAETLDHSITRSAFTVNLIMAWLMGTALFFASPWMAAFFNEAGLQAVLEVLSINFFLLPFGSTVTAMLMRDFQYGIRYKINIGQQLVQTGVTLALAFLGYGYMSPAWGSVAGMMATVAGCTFWGGHYRIHGISFVHWRAVLHFGVWQTTGSVVDRLGNSAPDFVIGRMLGFTATGLYSRGLGLVRMFRTNVIGAIGPVAFSALAESNRRNERPDLFYLKSLTFITGISWPFFAFAALMAFPVLRLMFGEQWDAAIPILRLLAIQAFISMMMTNNRQFFTAIGKIGAITRLSILIQIVRVAALIGGASISLVAVAAAQILVSLFAVVVTYATIFRHTEIGVSDTFKALLPSAIVTGVTMFLPCVLYLFYPPTEENLALPFLASCLAVTISWLAAIWLNAHPLWDELGGVMSQIAQRMKKRRAAKMGQ